MRCARLVCERNSGVIDLYLTSLAVGGVGLGVMAVSGFMHHGHGDAAGHGAHVGHAGDVGHAGHAGLGHAGHGHGGAHAGAHHGDSHGGTHGHHADHSVQHALLALMSPRTLFSLALGLGTAGVVLRPMLGGLLLFGAALAAGIAFERILVTPVWNFLFRFESRPALTLESAEGGEATAVSTFDANGQGLISIDLDGQTVQLLGTLRSADREMRVPVRVGTKLVVVDVDAARNRCIVSVL